MVLVLATTIVGSHQSSVVHAQSPEPDARPDLVSVAEPLQPTDPPTLWDKECPAGEFCPPRATWPMDEPTPVAFRRDGAQIPVAPMGVAPQAVGGPDDFGYTWDDTVPFSWIDAGTGTDTGLEGDDTYTPAIDIGFDFKFYENTFTQLYITTNGLLTFGAGAYHYSNQSIPNSASPNNFVAPFWDDLAVGSGYNSGEVYYLRGGMAPNRYFVAEWHEVSKLGYADTLTFEVILYENGDIVMQYLSLTGYLQDASVGIEDSAGITGLQYIFNSPGLGNNKAVGFHRGAPSARVHASPLFQGGFASGGQLTFEVAIRNTGELGADVYDIATSSDWTVSLYHDDAITALTDTDMDGVVDTGAIDQGGTITITARVTSPDHARVGDASATAVAVRSSIDTTKSKVVSLRTAIPATFAQVYTDDSDGAMTLYLIQPQTQVVKQPSTRTYGGNPTVAKTANSGFIYVWNRYDCLDTSCAVYGSEIEYALLDRNGDAVRGVTKLTDHSGATVNTYDHSAVAAVTPSGQIGVLWVGQLYDSNSNQYNYNIYFAVLDPSGNIEGSPINVTNNVRWGSWGDPDWEFFGSPRIAATSDNRFVLAWQRERQEAGGPVDDICYAVQAVDGSQVVSSTRLTYDTAGGDSGYRNPALAPLPSARVILSWTSQLGGNDDIYYAVLNSSGAVVKAATDISVDETVVDWQNSDVAQLSDGRILLAWEAWGCFPGEWTSRIRFAILDSSYNRIVAPTCLGSSPAAATGDGYVSVTAVAGGNAVMTWGDRDWNSHHNLYYALVNGDGAVDTPPMIFRTAEVTPWGSQYIATSSEGYGNTSYYPYAISLPLIMR